MFNSVYTELTGVDMASKLISFRLSDEAVEALQAQVEGGESLNLAAQRLLTEVLGTSTKALTSVDKRTLEQTIEAIVEERTANTVNSVNKELIERLETLEKQ